MNVTSIMNVARRNKKELYPVRGITDLKDMMNSNAALYQDRSAFLVKKKPGGKYSPISYNQVKADVDALGTALMDMGMAGTKIAVVGENRYEWVVADLAVCCGVGVVVPLDKELPIAEIRNLCERAEVSAVIYSGKLEKQLLEALSGLSFVRYKISMDAESGDDMRLSMKELISRGKRLINQEVRSFIDAEIDHEAMSFLLYTSGTTGLAKGVMLSHKNICANIMNMSMFVHLYADDVTLSVLPMHHTYEFTCNIMTVMYQGACIAICEGLKHIVKNMQEAEVTLIIGVPLIFESMHKKIWKQAEKTGQSKRLRQAMTISKTLNKFSVKSARKLFKSVHQSLGGNVRMFIAGAAAIDPIVIEDFNLMGINTFQGYGLTENSPIVAVNLDRYHKPASVGPGMPNTEIKLIDTDENGVGEILVKGDSVMLGYYNDKEETDKVLRDGWLYTGDYGYLDKDGFLYISGRKKNVIVTKNGKNIFPEEVEYYLNKIEYIEEVVVEGQEDESGDTIVFAHIVPDMETVKEMAGDLSEEELRKLLKKDIDDINELMPGYKRVKRFEIRYEPFEKTTTKKIKRFAI